MTLGELIKAARMGFARFVVGDFEAWLRITPHEKGLSFHFRKTLPPRESGGPKDHYVWWELAKDADICRMLHTRSPFLQRLVAGKEERPFPLHVVLDDNGVEVPE